MKWSFIDDYDTRYFSGNDLARLVLDQFYLNLISKDYEQFYLYTLNRNCIECPYLRFCDNGNCYLTSNTTNVFRTNLKFRISTRNEEYFPQDQKEDVICDVDEDFGQFGVYSIDIRKDKCEVEVLKEPVNSIYTPTLTVFLIYLSLYLLVYGSCKIWKKFKNSNKENGERTPKKDRVQSLDTFRGIAIVIMIFANYGCGGYDVLNHIKWNGLHVADLVFPWFMWIMGACIPISVFSSFKKSVPDGKLIQNTIIRSLKLFVLGIFLNSGPDLGYLRIFGVLQRFGVAYLVCTAICIFFVKRDTERSKHKIWKEVDDLQKTFTGWVIVLSLLITYLLVIFLVAAPGCPRGYMGPGGLHKNMSHLNCTGGATGYIDGLILGDHRYQNPTIYEVYEAKPFDPEGIVGCLTTIFQVFIGVQAGIIILIYKKPSERIFRWLTWATVTGLVGGALCGFSKEDGLIPLNKNLWSLSFALITSSLAFFLLCFCYIVIDVKKIWSGKPFLFAGMNAILMYIGHELTDGHFPIRWYLHNEVVPDDPRRTHFLALISDVWGVGMWVLVSYYLYKIEYFFTV